jgi:anti-sigma factor RsiW
MSLHTQEWLGAYLDGELSPAQIRKTEAHLANCPECQRKLDELRSLSALLGEAPVATGLKSEEQFVAEVGLQLKRKAITSAQTFPMTRSRENTPQSPALHWSWLVIPLVLLLAWSFVQTVSVVSDMLIAIPGIEQYSQKSVQALPLFANLSHLKDTVLARFGAELVGLATPLEWGWLANLLAMAIIGLLYASWMAGWWTHNRIFSQN